MHTPECSVASDQTIDKTYEFGENVDDETDYIVSNSESRTLSKDDQEKVANRWVSTRHFGQTHLKAIVPKGLHPLQGYISFKSQIRACNAIIFILHRRLSAPRVAIW